jgi:hypothetical protein
LRILAAAKDLSTLSIRGGGLGSLPLPRKELTVSVYGRSLAWRWVWRYGYVEKLRKALEKRTENSAVEKAKSRRPVNAIPLRSLDANESIGL